MFDRCNFADYTFSPSLRLSPLRTPSLLLLLFPSRPVCVVARPYHPSERHFIPLSPRREVGGRGVEGCTGASAVGCGGIVGVECGVLHGGGVGGRGWKGRIGTGGVDDHLPSASPTLHHAARAPTSSAFETLRPTLASRTSARRHRTVTQGHTCG